MQNIHTKVKTRPLWSRLGIRILLGGLLAIDVPQAASAAQTTLVVAPAFGPSVPDSSEGAVYYVYEFGGFIDGTVEERFVDGEVEGKTYHYATVGGEKTVDYGVGEYRYHIYRTADCIVYTETNYHCIQSKDGMPDIPVYNPPESILGNPCIYHNGIVYESMSPGPGCDVTNEVSEGPGWTLSYTHPTDLPCGWFFRWGRVDCGNGFGFIGKVEGSLGYYKIVVSLDEGAELPAGVLPTLPNPIIVNPGIGPGINPSVPRIEIIEPWDGQQFDSPSNIIIHVLAFDPSGPVGLVYITTENGFLGTAESVTGVPGLYRCVWAPPRLGDFTLIANTSSSMGVEIESTPVSITVFSSCTQPPILSGGHWSGNTFSFEASGVPGSMWNVYSSDNLANWQLAGSLTLNGGTAVFTDSDANVPGRYYKLSNR